MKRNDPEHHLADSSALAERLRQALIEAALAAHEDAGIRGLCCEGAWEAVVTTLRGLDLAPIVASHGERK